MSNGNDNKSGKPSGIPQIAPVGPPSRPLPQVTAPGVAPLVPQVTPVAPQPAVQPPGQRPPAPPNVVPQVTAPRAPGAAPAIRPLVPPVPAAPSRALVPPVAAARPPVPSAPTPGVLVPPVAAVRPLVPSAPTPGVLVQPAGPRAPATGASAVPSAPAPARAGPLPSTGAVEAIDAVQAAGLKQLADGLDDVDYFTTLGVALTAGPGDIKKAFYRESRTYHPDRFFHLPDSPMKSDIGAIYRRITEAYFVLRDDAKRRKYLADIGGADRANKLRYTDSTETELKAEVRKTVEEEFGTHPKSRPFFKTALADYEKQSWAAAERNLKMGLTYEPGNARFKDMLAEVRTKQEDERRGQGPSYLIK